MYKYPHSHCQTQTDTHTLIPFSFFSLLPVSLILFPALLPPPSSSSSVIMAWRRVVKFMTFRSRGAGWWRTRIVSRVPAGICLSLMSELYNVSTPDNLALAIFGSERESHLLHLVTEQWLPLQCLLLLDNLITVLTSTVCTTWNGIMGSVIKIKGDKILMLCSCSLPRLLSFLSALKLITSSTLRCLKGRVYLLKIQSCLCQTELSNSPRDTQQLERKKSNSSG